MAAIQQECEKHDCFRILIDENLDGPRFDEMEIFRSDESTGQEIFLGDDVL